MQRAPQQHSASSLQVNAFASEEEGENGIIDDRLLHSGTVSYRAQQSDDSEQHEPEYKDSDGKEPTLAWGDVDGFACYRKGHTNRDNACEQECKRVKSKD